MSIHRFLGSRSLFLNSDLPFCICNVLYCTVLYITVIGFSPNRGQKSVHNFKKSRKERLKLYRTVGHMCAVNLECILEGCSGVIFRFLTFYEKNVVKNPLFFSKNKMWLRVFLK